MRDILIDQNLTGKDGKDFNLIIRRTNQYIKREVIK